MCLRVLDYFPVWVGVVQVEEVPTFAVADLEWDTTSSGGDIGHAPMEDLGNLDVGGADENGARRQRWQKPELGAGAGVGRGGGKVRGIKYGEVVQGLRTGKPSRQGCVIGVRGG